VELKAAQPNRDVSDCPGCGLALPIRRGPAHPYIGASPACWALFGEVLAREFGDPAYFRLHQLTVDTYAVQHPGAPERRSIQSIALHLMTLCLVVEDGADPREGPKLHKRLVGRVPFHWLEPPRPNGRITVADVVRARTPAEHERAVEAWARDVWAAWEPHHPTIRRWIEQALPGCRAREFAPGEAG
jgi:Family of unknown function (DUF5946)